MTVLPSGDPGAQPTAVPDPKSRRRRKTALIGGSAVILAIAGAVAFLAWPGSGAPLIPADPADPVVPHGPATLAATFSIPGNDSLLSASFSPDGKFLAIVGIEGTDNDGSQKIYIWDTVTHAYRATLTVPTVAPLGVEVGSVGFSTDDSQVTATDSDGRVLRWNLPAGTPTVITPAAATGGVLLTDAALSGDGSILAARDPAADGTSVWDLRTGGLIADLTDPDGAPVTYVASLDTTGQTLAVEDATRMYIWSVPRRTVIATLPYPAGTNFKNAFAHLSADGKDVEVTESAGDGSPTLWDVATQSNVTPRDARWPRQFALVDATAGTACATQPDGAEYIDLWNIATRSHILTVGGPGDPSGFLYAVGSGGHELLTSPNNRAEGHQLYLWSIP